MMDLIGRERDGRFVIGSDQRGCQHCGTVESHVSACGRVEWKHPGVLCCRDAVKDQLRYRKDDLAALRRKAEDGARAVQELFDRGQQAIGREAQEAQTTAQRAERAHQARLAAWRPMIDDLRSDVQRYEDVLRAWLE
jgi:hypothetical protein